MISPSWLTGRHLNLPIAVLTDWLNVWMTDLLSDWLTDWLIYFLVIFIWKFQTTEWWIYNNHQTVIHSVSASSALSALIYFQANSGESTTTNILRSTAGINSSLACFKAVRCGISTTFNANDWIVNLQSCLSCGESPLLYSQTVGQRIFSPLLSYYRLVINLKV